MDDIIIGCESEKEINGIKSALSQRFEMKDLGSLKYFLGVNVIQNIEQGTVFINQATYIKSLLRKFEFTDAKSVKSHVDVSAKDETDDDTELIDKTFYQSAVGSLLYLSTKTPPDITFAVSYVARHSSKSTKVVTLLVR